MRNLFLITFIVALIHGMSGCGVSENDKLIAKIDSLKNVLSKKDSIFKTIKLEETYKIIEQTKKEVDYIKSHYDTLSKEQAMAVSDYYRSQRSLDKMLKSIEDIQKEILLTQNQLDDLKVDVRNRVITLEEFYAYYNSEQEAVKRVEEALQNIQQWNETGLKRHKELREKIKDLLPPDSTISE
jgi:chromosome segregation ATPase